MKFTVNKSEINEAVSNIQRVVSSKSSIPALEGILMNTHEDQLILSANDLELGIRTNIPSQNDEDGSIVLNAKIFSDIVRKSPAAHITITVDEKNNATIESGKSRFYIGGIDTEEFPELATVMDSVRFEMESSVLKSMIRQTLFAVAESDAKPIHQGCLFHFYDGKLDIVSVDGYRLAKRTEAVEISEPLSFVVPGKTLAEVNRLLKDTDMGISVYAGKRNIMFSIENYTVVSSLLEGEFLNYQATIPSSHTTLVTVNTRAAIESVERVSLLITERLKSPLHCAFSDNRIGFQCTTTMGKASDMIEADVSGEDLEIGFNNRYLLDALKNTECDEVRLELGSALSPMKILPLEGDSFLFLVLPVRLKG